MSQHRFLTSGKIAAEDIERLIVLTKSGSLEWCHSEDHAAFNAYPVLQGAKDSFSVSAEVIGDNLCGIRIGYEPETLQWHYVRLQDHEKNFHYIEAGSPDELMQPASRLYDVACRAREFGGRLTRGEEARLVFCDLCEKETEHIHLITAPYGLEGAYMSGSERYKCVECGNAIFSDEEIAKKGLKYNYETS